MISPKELKNQILELKCEALGSNFEGICRYDGYTLFVDGALPSEIIKARVEKCKKTMVLQN
ncbi:MAG: TRAM domain-containing protein [Eubacteriales bacterium]|nr:TRAM domain-containing protein [Eubacteriales bacterium]